MAEGDIIRSAYQKIIIRLRKGGRLVAVTNRQVVAVIAGGSHITDLKPVGKRLCCRDAYVANRLVGAKY